MEIIAQVRSTSVLSRTHEFLSRRVIEVLTVVLALFMASLLIACSGKTKAAAPSAPIVPVLAATVEQKDFPVQVQAIGSVEAYSTVAVKTQVTGELTGVFFHEGQDVKKGDLIFTLDKRPFEAALKQAQSMLAKDQAQAELAQVQARRYAALMKDGVVAKEQYDQVQSSADALAAAVEADKATVENARVQLNYCSIYSPIHGRVGSLLIHQGNMIKANDVPLVNINQIEPIRVAFTVPEQYLAEIKRFAAAGRLPVRVSVPNDSRPATGKLSFIDNTVDPATGTIKLKGEFVNADRRLWPGQFVDVVLTLHTQPNAVVVPSQAVNTGQQGQFVFVIKPDMTVEARTVAVNRTAKGETVIDKGVNAGERVVTDGQLRLVPGSKVQIKEALAPQSAPSNGESTGSPSATLVDPKEARA
jgi:multidrug efflux system membrane fusion protein